MNALRGCRVLDLGIITAGAATAAVLADYGAEVIKIESLSYRDPFRRWLSERPADAPADLPPFFRATNRGKLGLSLDLKQARGREVFLKLVKNSDVVVENFRRGVMDKLGIGFDVLKAVNPNIILASISSQGETGPEALYVSYGSTLEAVAGLAWATGYENDDPMVSGVDLNYPDQVVALFASSMIVTAWRARVNGAGGAHLDMSQRELTSYLLGEAFAAAGVGHDSHRTGNAQPPHALQDCFRSADGRWLAVTVDAERVSALVALIQPGLDPCSEVQLKSEVRVKDALTAWVAARQVEEARNALQSLHIAAAIVLTGRQVFEQRGHYWEHALQRSPAGAVVKGFPLQFDVHPMSITADAPAIGADSEHVLRQVAELSPGDIEDLRAAGVIELSPPSTFQESVNV
jgi:crotonobetainyl-CoA:carnitine CoA-transferase CaiB-like acyl-CoA transferase